VNFQARTGRPLLITDCDEVLLHMVTPFGEWLDQEHAIDFAMERPDFSAALTRRADSSTVEEEHIGPLLDAFFTTEMHRQTLVPHVQRALATIAELADIVVLTNLTDQFHAGRVAQLEAVDIRHRVQCNQGWQGPAGRRPDRRIPPLGNGVRRRPGPASQLGRTARPRRMAAAHGRRAAHRPASRHRLRRPCPDRRLGRGAAMDHLALRLMPCRVGLAAAGSWLHLR
jgi:hypothetical protein